MLKKRIIPIELFDGNRLVKTRSFTHPRDVGNPIKSSQVYSDQDADELIFLNVMRKNRSSAQSLEVLSEIARTCFVPLSVGGGIKSIEDAAQLFAVGADKVIINSEAYKNLSLITKITDRYGKQSVITCIDVRSENNGNYKLYSNCGQEPESRFLIDHIQKVTSAGTGEIMIQAIDRDGVMNGYDLELIQEAVSISSVPIIIAGGAGNFLDLKIAFDLGVEAVACGSLFNFGDNNPLRAKAYLKNHNIPLKKI